MKTICILRDECSNSVKYLIFLTFIQEISKNFKYYLCHVAELKRFRKNFNLNFSIIQGIMIIVIFMIEFRLYFCSHNSNMIFIQISNIKNNGSKKI